MEILAQFKDYLEKKKITNKITLKNYISDIRHFINWFEKSFGTVFIASEVREDLIELFKGAHGASVNAGNVAIDEKLSEASLKRHLSSLRQFSKFLIETGNIDENPFEKLSTLNSRPSTLDKWHIQEFKDYLKFKKASDLTIKNYVTDIHSFRRWYEKTIEPYIAETTFPLINDEIVEDYKQRLLNEKGSAPSTVNRKLSSLRKFVEFATLSNYIDVKKLYVSPVAAAEMQNFDSESKGVLSLNDIEGQKIKLNYSSIPPIRLTQKLIILPYILLEEAIAAKISRLVFGASALNLATKRISPALSRLKFSSTPDSILGVKGYEKSFYAPEKISTDLFPLHKKLWHHIRYTRPQWYKNYHNIPVVHYIHFAILVIFLVGVGIALYRNLVTENNNPLFAAPTSPPRILSFQGRLTDNLDNPITTATDIRFSIYNDLSASGAALLWQENHYNVSPDQDGIFSVLLGTLNAIPDSVFLEHDELYLGVTIEQTSELTPRRRLASVPYAANSGALQGMLPITDGSAGTTNVVLALDSAGDLTIGGAATPSFTATGGQFELSGNVLLLSTLAGTNSNVVVNPDGLGKIDLRKPLINTTNNGNLTPGGVEVNDRFGVLATESAVAAFLVNNNTTGGDIFSASSSGTTRFTIANNGALTIPVYNTAGGIFYANGSGVLAQTTAGSGGQCLQSAGGAAPTWGTCGAGSLWRINAGTISPINDTLDFLVGANSTGSAKFAILNVNSGNPTATLSGNLSIVSPTGANPATLFNILNGGSLNIGTSIGGDAGLTSRLFISNGGNIGIGTTSPLVALDVRGLSGTTAAATVSAKTSFAALTVDNSGVGDLFAASASGVPNFVVKNNGDIVVGQNGTGKITAAVIDPYLIQNQYTTGNTQLTFQTLATSNGDFVYKNQSTTLATLTQPGQFQLPITGSAGGLLIGGDTQLFRGAADRLDLASGDSFNVISGNIQTGGITRVDSSGNGFFNNLTVSSCSGCGPGGSASPFQELSGKIVPLNSTLDFMVGGQSTESAKFAVTGILAGTSPAASVSATTGGSAGLGVSMIGTGRIQSLRNGSLTLGGDTTGNILLSPLNDSGRVGINTALPGAALDVNGSILLAGGGTIDTRTGSTLGIGTTTATTITIGRATQGITLPGFTTNGGLFYANGSGVLAQTGAGGGTQCLLGGTTPTWGSCSAGGTDSPFQVASGTIQPLNTTLDFLVGGQTTESAKFAILNINNGTPTASVSATGATDRPGLYMTGDGILSSVNKGTLTIGSSNTGNIAIGTDSTARSITIGNTTGGSSLDLNAGSGGINFGDNATTKTINIGGVANTGTDTINIATNGTAADAITIGNSNASTTLALTGGDDWSITAGGALTVTSCIGCGGSSQTPWTSDIDADGFDLTDLSNLEFRETTGAPAGTVVGLFRDNAGDLNINALSGKSVNLQVAGTDEYNFSSTALTMNSNNITGVGTTISATAGLAISTATTNALSLDTGTTGAINIGTGANAKALTFGNTGVATTFGFNTGVSTTTGMTLTANSLSTGTGLSLTSSGSITTGGEILAATANSATTGRLFDLSATGLTTGQGIQLTMGTALTTGSGISVSGASYGGTTTTESSLASLAFTDARSNTSGNSIVNGLSIASTVNTSGATGTKVINPLNVAAPTLTACTGGACTWNGLNLNTATSGFLSTITQNGLNISATGASAGTLRGLNISSITGGAGTENAIVIGSGWDNQISGNGWSVNGSGALTVASCSGCGGGGVASPFQELSGKIVPLNSTLDFMVGGQSTESAKFAVLNLNGSGPATATVSGNLIVMPNNGAGGMVGIGKSSNLLASLDIKDRSSLASLGSEKITAVADRDFSSDTGSWTTTGTPAWKINVASSGKAVKDAPGTGYITLNNTALDSAPVVGDTYQIVFEYTTTSSSSGSLTMEFGGTGGPQVAQENNGINTQTQVIKATSTTALRFTPTMDWYGSIDNISIKKITTSTVALRLESSDGTTNPLEIRAGGNGLFNTFIGNGSGRANTTGSSNLAVGYQALYNNTTGGDNTAGGPYALYSNTTGSSNTANGTSALYNNTTGFFNTANGASALRSNTTGIANTADGALALYSNTTGSYNTADGYQALRSNTTGNGNTAGGTYALYYNTTGSLNTANGYYALYNNTTGNYNTAGGYQALYNNTTGSNNTADGYYALYNNTTGIENTANGNWALYNNTIGRNNSAQGFASLYNNISGASNTGDGYYAGYSNTVGGLNTFLGYDADVSAGHLINATAIGARALVSANDSLVLGSIYGVNNATGSAKIGIGTTTPTATLHVNGNYGANAAFILNQENSGDIFTASASGNTKFVINNSGQVGIGTDAAPASTFNSKLNVYSNLGTTPAASISAKTSNAALLVTNDGVGDLITASSSGTRTFAVRANGDILFTGTTFGPNADFAEYFKKANPNEIFEDGDLVCTTNAGGATKCDSGNPSHRILGVVSKRPGFVGNGNFVGNPNYVLVGMVGQLPVKVDGQVKKGDPITMSSVLGKGKSTEEEGNIIGYALEDSQNFIVRTTIQAQYYRPSFTASLIENFNLSVTNGIYTLRNASGNVVNTIGAFSNLVAANVRAGFINVQKLSASSLSAVTGTISNLSATSLNATSAVLGSVQVSSENVLIAGVSLRDYIAGVVEEVVSDSNFLSSDEIISPVASIDNVKTNFISPLADGNIELEVKPDKLAVNNSETNTTVAEIDNEGNATFSGVISSDTLQTNDATISGNLAANNLQTNNATISGTLNVDRIVANTIDGLDDKIAAGIESRSKNYESSTGTATNSSSLVTDNQSLTTLDELEVGNVYADYGIYSEGLTVLGAATAAQITAMDSLSVGTGFVVTENSINTLGATLEIQPLRQGNISFMAGKVKFDTDGNVDIAGNLNIAGLINAAEGVFNGIQTNSLATNIISPLPDSDLVIKLGNNGGDASDSGNVRFANSDGQEILKISGEGNVVASGSGTFDKLNFNLVGEALAETDTTAVATGSAGFATLNRNRAEVTIYNSKITENSLIYITPFGDTQNKVLHLLRQTPQTETADGSFTVGVSGTPATRDLQFNWLIVN